MFKKYINFFKDWSNQKTYINWLFKHTKPYMSSLVMLLIMDIILSLLSVGMSVAGKIIIDSASLGKSIEKGVFIYIILVITGLVFGAVYSILSIFVNENFSFGIRKKVYRSILDTCWQDISEYHTGDLMTRLTSDINTVASGIAGVVPSIISLFVKLIVAFFTLMYFDKSFAIFALLLGPIAAFVSVLLGKAVKRLQVKVQETEAAYRSYMQESISNITIIKSFCYQDLSEENITRLRNDRMFWVIKKQVMSVIASTAMNITYYAGYITAFVWGAIKLSKNTITYGTMSVFLSLVNQVQEPVMDLSKTIPQIVSVLASAGRVIEIQNLPRENIKKLKHVPKKLNIDINNISFGYSNDSILSNASLHLKSGEFVAVVGTSGIGKTTLVRLIMSFLSPDSGSIELEDENGNTVKAGAELRKFISYVPQGNTLISGTIADNLRIGKPDATDNELWNVLKYVKADSFVKELPQSLYTKIGEKSLGLSEGQAQRISIARAIIKNAPLLILDEATSALDEETEISVLKNIRNINPRPACILITHRSSALRFCDREIKLKEGQIFEKDFK